MKPKTARMNKGRTHNSTFAIGFVLHSSLVVNGSSVLRMNIAKVEISFITLAKERELDPKELFNQLNSKGWIYKKDDQCHLTK